MDFVIDALAAYRITRLVTEDTITEPIRERIEARAIISGRKRLAKLVSCPWCVGVYVGVGVVVARAVAPRQWAVAARALALSAATGIVAERA